MKEHAFYVGREGREVFWNIPLPSFEIILFALTAVALAIMASLNGNKERTLEDNNIVIASAAKQSRATYATLDCFASLAMTRKGL